MASELIEDDYKGMANLLDFFHSSNFIFGQFLQAVDVRYFVRVNYEAFDYNHWW